MVSSMGEDSFKNHFKSKLGAEKSQSAAYLDPDSAGTCDSATTTAVNTGVSQGFQDIGTHGCALNKRHRTTRQTLL